MRKTFCLFAIFMLISSLLFIIPVFAEGWVSPIGFDDPDNNWVSEPNAYDENTASCASTSTPYYYAWTYFLHLTVNDGILCNKIRYAVPWLFPVDEVDLDVYDGEWHDVYQGAPTKPGFGQPPLWNEHEFEPSRNVTKMRVRLHVTEFMGGVAGPFYEADFWVTTEEEDTTAPTYSNIGTNASHCREVCEFSCLWKDETELSGYIFGWNGTGSFLNDTWASLSGTPEWANKTKTLPNNDCIVSFQWWCNDTSNNWNTTELQTLNVTDCYIVARFTFSISNPEPNENIFFNGSCSVSSSTITSYEWTFGDGNTDSGATVTHSYSTENTFSITLNVTSTDGSDTFTLNLTVAEAQVVEDQGSSGGLYSLLIHVTWNQVPCFANVTVQNSQGNDSTTGQTDLLGNAKFSLPMGIYFVSTSYRNHTLEDTVHLNENSVVSFNFKVKGGPTWIALLAVIIVLAIGYVWIGKKKKTRKHEATLEPRSHKPTTKPRKHEDNLKPRKQTR